MSDAGNQPVMTPDQSIIRAIPSGSGLQAGELFKIDRAVVIVDRNPKCNLALEPKSVSYRQAALWSSPAGTDSNVQTRQACVTLLSFARATLVRERTIWQRGLSCLTGTGSSGIR